MKIDFLRISQIFFTGFSYFTSSALRPAITAISSLAAMIAVCFPWRWSIQPIPSPPSQTKPLIPSSTSTIARDPNLMHATEKPVIADIVRDYEEVMNNLATLLRTQGPKIYEQITKIDRSEDLKSSQQLDLIARNLAYLLHTDIQPPLAFRVNFERTNIFNVPSDGNCLYHAFLLGLFFYNRINPADISHLDLRAFVIGWLRTELAKPIEQKDPFVETFLQMSIDDYQDSKKKEKREELATLELVAAEETPEGANARARIAPIREELAILEQEQISFEDYLTRASQPGFFCSSAELFALGKLHGDIKIIVKSNADTVLTTINPEQEDTIELILDSSHYRIRSEIARTQGQEP